ncbi:toll/interleukin-1 receptor domain-containing protein [Methylomonas rivi]|uniref:Toll/interleukin-1 receptor domain-containing protein n=1 Tax=Methylomonas rivi TaxID=2952226 RepID=A0ABT1UA72_9GAMM|nr:toll/interleukin-1 receptor domain-containing protein [Methylomonas sp. WSC-6]MCQ8130754.1 toll/interleukin-1 receptor domain-containing protein [Methylomonas sp. WSC-6]
MSKIFISYRREDSAGYSGRLADRLALTFGDRQIFRDFEDINPGQNFAESIQAGLSGADVFLVVIGPRWLQVTDHNGRRRLDNAEDFVRLEIETALQRDIQIIPILVNGAKMPRTADLPTSLTTLIYRQALELSDSRWEQDVGKLIGHIKNYVKPVKNNWSPRRIAVYAVTTLLALAGMAVWLSRQPADFSGQWYFAGGDYLLISQQDNRVKIERIDPAMQTVYERGEGQVDGRRLTFNLEPVYSDRFKHRGIVKKSWNGQTLAGELIEVFSDTHDRLVLDKQPPAKAAGN